MSNQTQTEITALRATPPSAKLIESVVIQGDLSNLTAAQRVEYYSSVCQSLGLNPLTKPFDFIKLNGKLTLYARKDATDQLRKVYNVSLKIVSREQIGDVYIVTAQARLPSGREDESTGAVNTAGLSGDALANAFMKAETKSKRRVTLSICGLGLLDETETETIPEVHSNVSSQSSARHTVETSPSVEHAPPASSGGNSTQQPGRVAPLRDKEFENKFYDRSRPATEKQKNMIWARLKRLQFTDSDAKDFIISKTNKPASKDLTMDDVNHLVEEIDKYQLAKEKSNGSTTYSSKQTSSSNRYSSSKKEGSSQDQDESEDLSGEFDSFIGK